MIMLLIVKQTNLIFKFFNCLDQQYYEEEEINEEYEGENEHDQNIQEENFEEDPIKQEGNDDYIYSAYPSWKFIFK